MIHPDSRSLAWIERVAKENRVKDLALAEKAIRAFSLLEALVRSGCPLLFKGGTAEMLHMNSAKRLSIDIDIICPPGTRIEDYLKVYSNDYGFVDVELVDCISRIDIPKKHAKYYYEVSYPSGIIQDKILLDAPHTTGIPFFKGERDCSMEIIKQLFDVASLFDRTYDLSITKETFRNLATIELHYRNSDSLSLQDVLNDIFNTSRCICLIGIENAEEFRLLQNGIGRVRNYIHSENYNLDSAIINASKVAYLSKLLEKEISEVQHFDANKTSQLYDAIIKEPLLTKFNKFKKSNIEAFFYWNEIQELM